MSDAPAEHLRHAEEALTARDLPLAIENFRAAERSGADPDHCSGGRWLAFMLGGDFEAAWREGDLIRARGVPDPHRFWQGEDLRGKRVIVRSLHGFGDAVQMLCFAPRLWEVAASVVYEVPPRFVELARCFAGVDEVITWGEDAPIRTPEWDVQVEVMELPYLLRLHAQDLPAAVEYVAIAEAEVQRVAAAMGPRTKPRIGLVWSCGDWNLTRCLPPEALAALTREERLEFWSLEGAGGAQQTAALGLRDSNRICGDGMVALGATIANLDLVVTVDTLAAHFAGALGKPVWLLLQYAADWRWMHARSDSPWYPTLRIFRQRAPGDWAAVIANVQRELRGLVA